MREYTEKWRTGHYCCSTFTNLVNLYLEGNNITDISPLDGLTKLLYLDLSGNNISDISTLAGLTNLNKLDFTINNLSDISALVENNGLGESDDISLEFNELDLTDGSNDMANIKVLQDRGVLVSY